MSNVISAAHGASFDGAVRVEDAGVKGMITVRGDLSSAKMAKAVKAAVGLAMPDMRGVGVGAKGGVAWMSPDELMVFCEYADVDAIVAKLEKALKGEHFLAVNVSDARSMFTLTGEGVREVIAKGSPADMSVEGLPLGEMRRSRLGQIAVAFWLTEEGKLELVCFRSVGQFVYEWLCNGAVKETLPNHL
jgi:sarcosine oxidase subunit gamma